ncbi:SDR family NAD(P)-dependent oxidoreductase [Massilia sp. TN1-12]|uniref:SDR family NAD(P)-dependent oxidoreductase n=1 Tax=Massilia paldalensis TaxID=3377675 RepID=UPI00384F97D4
MNEFAGRVAVVTGAAGGLGRAIAERAAALGMKLVLADLDSDALEMASEELQAGGAEVLALVCDVRKCTHVEELADAAMIRFHAVHVLFNVGSCGAPGLVWEYAEADWEAGAGANLGGAINGVRIFAPLMLGCAARDPSYRGHIVNSAALHGLAGAPALGMDNVSAHGLLALSETLYHDLRLVDAPVTASLLCARALPARPAHAHHHRGEAHGQTLDEAGRQAVRCLVDEALPSAPATLEDVALHAFDGMARGEFLLCADPQTLVAMAERIAALARGSAPADPLALAPRIRAHLSR